MAVLGVIKGFSGLPSDIAEWRIRKWVIQFFINTTYSFNSAVVSTEKYAHRFRKFSWKKRGGKGDFFSFFSLFFFGLQAA